MVGSVARLAHALDGDGERLTPPSGNVREPGALEAEVPATEGAQFEGAGARNLPISSRS